MQTRRREGKQRERGGMMHEGGRGGGGKGFFGMVLDGYGPRGELPSQAMEVEID
jgi:hypothetical protein